MSGTLLAMFSPELTAGMVCNRLAGYLVIVASVLAMLFYRMKREEMKFPKGLTLTPLSTGLASLFLAAVLGF